MSSQLKTPGVYVEEISKFPPSVAQVETAIPAFVGYTEKGGSSSDPQPVRITSMLEYESIFGGAKKEKVELVDTEAGLTLKQPDVKFLMYYSMQMFFANGGGPCYVVSVGNYADVTAISKAELKKGLDTLEREDEPTLLLFPDAVKLSTEADFYAIYQDALTQANELKDRFVIMDTYKGNSADETTIGSDTLNTIGHFRSTIAGDKYGAAYFPHLSTVLNYAFDDETAMDHAGFGGVGVYSAEVASLATIKANVDTAIAAIVDINSPTAAEYKAVRTILKKAITVVKKVNKTADTIIDFSDLQSATDNLESADLSTDNPSAEVEAVRVDISTNAVDLKGDYDALILKDLKLTNAELYNKIYALIKAIPVVLPPSATMAGVYAKTDSSVGVWKAPANVGLNYVIEPTEKISKEDQAGLNVDSVSGKSINAIRKFRGKGTLVWGARTLDGNSNEWRYVPVRRFFNMVEESVKKAAEQFVFESNDSNTWIRIKGMIDNFLNLQWRAGALAGSTPEEAYYVSVGLNETMSAQDILEGRMNIEIGMAAVRPAEFIVLKFSHKLQES